MEKFANCESLFSSIQNNSSLAYIYDNRSKITSVFKNIISYNELVVLIEQETNSLQEMASKNIKLTRQYLHIAEQLFQCPNKRDESLKWYQKALLTVPFGKSISKTYSKNTVDFIYALIARYYTEKAEYKQALDNIDQALNLASNLANRNFFLLTKINLLIKLNRFNEADQLIECLQKVDIPRIYQAQLYRFKQELTRHKCPTEQLPRYRYEIEQEPRNLELDENCFVDYSPIKGRHLRTQGDIAYGTYVLQENAISVAMYGDYLVSKCCWCHRALKHVLFPCRGCSQVGYCNPSCEQASFEKGFHRFECGLLEMLCTNVNAVHAYRLVSLLGLHTLMEHYTEHNQTIEPKNALSDYVKQEHLNSIRIEEMDTQNQLKLYTIIDSFVDHPNDFSKEIHIAALAWAVKIVIMVNQREHYFENVHTNSADLNGFLLLADKVASLIRKVSFNAFGWSEIDDEGLTEHYLIGNCICLVSSFINHSCDANAYWEVYEGRLSVATASVITKGDQICISYGPYADDDFVKRQKKLFHYNFICDCVSCLQDVRDRFCLRCRHCNGPVMTDLALMRGATVQCMSCQRAFDISSEEVTNIVQESSRLLFACKYANYGIDLDNETVVNTVHYLGKYLFNKSTYFQEIFFAAIEFLANKSEFDQAIQISERYEANITLRPCKDEQALLHRISQLTRWIRLYNRVSNGNKLYWSMNEIPASDTILYNNHHDTVQSFRDILQQTLDCLKEKHGDKLGLVTQVARLYLT